MSKKINIGDLPEFDLAEHLKTNEDIALYLRVVLEEDDLSEVMHALIAGCGRTCTTRPVRIGKSPTSS